MTRAVLFVALALAGMVACLWGTAPQLSAPAQDLAEPGCPILYWTSRVVCGWSDKGWAAPAQDLAEQSIAKSLQRAFPAAEANYLLVEGASGKVLAARWPQPEGRIPVGSLVKPFSALAWFESGDARYPQFRCRGTADGCWFPRGHGRIGMAEAVGFSCNAYFRALVARLRPEQVAQVAERFGMDGPGAQVSAGSLLGLGDEWLVSPLALVRAYLELVSRRAQPGVQELVQGLALAVRQGTAAAARGRYAAQLLAKTGTAACTHANKAPGDGFAIVMYPAERPRLVLLVRMHGRPGSEAARVAGRMLDTALAGAD